MLAGIAVSDEKVLSECDQLPGCDQEAVPKQVMFETLGLSFEWRMFKNRMKNE